MKKILYVFVFLFHFFCYCQNNELKKDGSYIVLESDLVLFEIPSKDLRFKIYEEKIFFFDNKKRVGDIKGFVISEIIDFSTGLFFSKESIRSFLRNNTGFNTASGGSEANSIFLDYLNSKIGQVFYHGYDTDNYDFILWKGTTHNWLDHPKLQAKHTSQPNGFILDNLNGTFTIVDHSDFLRSGSTNIGNHVDDTTAPNGLTFTYIAPNPPTSTQVNGGSGNTIRGRTGGNNPQTFTGDSETAPDHRNAYFGIYGDF